MIKANIIENTDMINNDKFTDCDKTEIEINIALLLESFINENPLSFSYERFENILEEYIYSNINIILNELNPNNEKYNETIIRECYTTIKNYYFTTHYPIRSYKRSFIRKRPNNNIIAEKINSIKNKPQPEQRTTEWYMFRHNLITSSSAWKALKSESYKNQLIVEKCKTLNVDKYNSVPVNTNTPFHHGHKYEEVSVNIYEEMYNTKIEDFGCIQHDKYKFLGASPDGINTDPTNDRYGRMLEIKNPVSRVITGIPKEEYWIQMQLQMETCNLNECDFLETSFKEYENEEEFNNDGTFTYTANNELKGIIVYFIKNEKQFYEYMPIKITKAEYTKWYDKILELHSNLTWVKNIYWKVEKISCVLVLRNKTWFNNAISKIGEVWDIINTERVTGYEHRMPKNPKKSCSKPLDNSNEHLNNIDDNCLINICTLQNQIVYINTAYDIDISDISGVSVPSN
jgi:putative phage-type endonuclease